MEIQINTPKELLPVMEFRKIDSRTNLPFTAKGSVPVSEKIKEEYHSAAAFNTLLHTLVARFQGRPKRIVDIESIFNTKGSRQVLFINPEDSDKVPPHFKDRVYEIHTVRKGTVLRVLPESISPVIKFREPRVKKTEDGKSLIYTVNYDINIKSFYIEFSYF